MHRAVVVAPRDSTIKVAARIVATFVRVAMDTRESAGVSASTGDTTREHRLVPGRAEIGLKRVLT
jgi:hypothetical protein